MNIALLAWCPPSGLYLDALKSAGCRSLLVIANPSMHHDNEGFNLSIEHRQSANTEDFLTRMQSFAPDLIVVTGWPEILRQPVRRLPRLGIVNFHPSLLPDYRGKHPLFWAILRGEGRVGITLHHLTAQIDAGPILLQQPVEVPVGVTTQELAELVDRAGARLVPQLMAWAKAGQLPEGYLPDRSGSSFPPVLEEYGLLDFGHSADLLERLVRACRGVTPAYCFLQGMKLMVLEARAVRIGHTALPGTLVSCDRTGAAIATAPGASDALLVESWMFFGREQDSAELADALELRAGQHVSCNHALDKITSA